MMLKLSTSFFNAFPAPCRQQTDEQQQPLFYWMNKRIVINNLGQCCQQILPQAMSKKQKNKINSDY